MDVTEIHSISITYIQPRLHLAFVENDATRFDVVYFRTDNDILSILGFVCPSLSTTSDCSRETQIGLKIPSFTNVNILQALPRASASADFTILIESDTANQYVLIKISASDGTVQPSHEFYAFTAQDSSLLMNWAGLVLAPTTDL